MWRCSSFDCVRGIKKGRGVSEDGVCGFQLNTRSPQRGHWLVCGREDCLDDFCPTSRLSLTIFSGVLAETDSETLQHIHGLESPLMRMPTPLQQAIAVSAAGLVEMFSRRLQRRIVARRPLAASMRFPLILSEDEQSFDVALFQTFCTLTAQAMVNVFAVSYVAPAVHASSGRGSSPSSQVSLIGWKRQVGVASSHRAHVRSLNSARLCCGAANRRNCTAMHCAGGVSQSRGDEPFV
eukprot:m.197297 g.197297  ORF g.197297 m.197297 type:complete len:237 (-) comp10642_c0_seq12:902-1612(-)